MYLRVRAIKCISGRKRQIMNPFLLIRRLLEWLGLWKDDMTLDKENTEKQLEQVKKTIIELENKKKDMEFEVEQFVKQIANTKKEMEGLQGAKLKTLNNTMSLLIQQFNDKKASLEKVVNNLSTNYTLKQSLTEHLNSLKHSPDIETIRDAIDKTKEDNTLQTEIQMTADELKSANSDFQPELSDVSDVSKEVADILGDYGISTTEQPSEKTPESEPVVQNNEPSETVKKTDRIDELEKKIKDLS